MMVRRHVVSENASMQQQMDKSETETPQTRKERKNNSIREYVRRVASRGGCCLPIPV
jgi:hypothetical protein